MSLSFSLIAVTVKIPEDILLEILARLPADSVMRFKCVSKLWYSLISSRYFTDLFFKFSSSTKRERRVFVYTGDCMLFSSWLSNLDATASFVQLNHDLTLPGIDDRLEFVNALRGLICFRVRRDTEEGDTQIRIINFATKQVLSLPLVGSNVFLESDEYPYVWNYFGYDPINDEYKVLSIISSIDDETWVWRSETWVLVLGEGASWRNTKSLTSPPPPLDPDDGGFSINGVLYYGAWSDHEKRSVLMSFDFSSEEFNLIELPMEYRIKWFGESCIVELMNYQDQVAVLDGLRLKTECILDLWVFDNAGKNKWSHKVLLLPWHQIRASLELEDMDKLYITGSSRSGEVTLCGGRQVNRNNRSAHAFYDLEKNRITRGFFIESPYPSSRFLQTNLWDDVESIMYLEA